MVLVAAGGVHDQEHHQENDNDDPRHAPLGHAAAHFDGRENSGDLSHHRRCREPRVFAAVGKAWVLTGLLSDGEVEGGGDGGTIGVDRRDLHFVARPKRQVLDGYDVGAGRQLRLFPLGAVFLLRAGIRRDDGLEIKSKGTQAEGGSGTFL